MIDLFTHYGITNPFGDEFSSSLVNDAPEISVEKKELYRPSYLTHVANYINEDVEKNGVKFKMYIKPPHVVGYERPYTVTIQRPEGLKEGPEDERIRTIDFKEDYVFGQFEGEAFPPVQPDKDGNFDYLDVQGEFDFLNPEHRKFAACQMYATVRRVLDIFTKYNNNEKFELYFEKNNKLHIFPLVYFVNEGEIFDNAFSGYGRDKTLGNIEYLAFGFPFFLFPRKEDKVGAVKYPFCLNFDVLAHEMGHTITRTLAPFPPSGDSTSNTYYGGLQESMGDLVAFVSNMHFDEFIDNLLLETKGNICTLNSLTATGDMPHGKSIRLALNSFTLREVTKEVHDLSQPFTGALVDVFLLVYLLYAVQEGAIDQDLANKSFENRFRPQSVGGLGRLWGVVVADKEKENKLRQCLHHARDYLGQLLLQFWKIMKKKSEVNEETGKYELRMNYSYIYEWILLADKEVSQGNNDKIIMLCFERRLFQRLDKFNFTTLPQGKKVYIKLQKKEE